MYEAFPMWLTQHRTVLALVEQFHVKPMLRLSGAGEGISRSLA